MRPVKIIIAGIDQFSKNFEAASSKLKKMGAGMSTIGNGLTAGITLPVVAAGLAATKFSQELNASMANVQSLGLSSKRVNELKKNVQGLAIESGKSTTVVSEGLYDLVSAFGDSSETAKLLSINVKASAAGLSSVQEAISLTSAVTKGYNDTSAAAVQKASDLAFMTVKLGQTTFPQLAASMGTVVPLSKELGVSQEELFSVFATATGVTGNAAAVSTQFRGVLQALLAPSKQMTQLMEAYGIKSGKAMIAQKGVAGAIKFITDKAKEVNMPLQNLIGSIEGQTIALSLAGSQATVYADKSKQMMNAVGAADKAFADQTQGVNKSGFKIQQLQQRLVVLGQKFGDAIAPALDKIVSLVEPMIDALTNISPALIPIIAGFAAVAAAIGPLLVIGSQLIGAISSITGAVTAAGGAMAILYNPIGWVIGGIALLTGAVTFMVTHWESKWAKLMAIVFPFAGIVAIIIKKWDKIGPFFRLLILPIQLLFMGLWKVAKWVFGKIADFAMFIFTPLESFIDTVLDGLTKIMNMALPDWVKEKIGLKVEGKAPSAENLAGSMAQAETNKSEFKGTLKIVGAPKGSTVTTDEGTMDTEMENGAIMGGY